jgi:uncharacterized protein YndB with AHSA1/START domain
MEAPRISYSIYIAATPERVWEALTSSEDLQQYWYGRRFQTDWEVGSLLQVLRPDGSVDWDGLVLEVDRPRRLSYTFQIQGFQTQSSRLVFELVPEGSVLRLNLAHYDVESRCVEDIREAWPAFCSTLKSLVETGAALPLKG